MRSKSRRPRVQMIIADFFVQGEKESGGGCRLRFFTSSSFEETLAFSELEL